MNAARGQGARMTYRPSDGVSHVAPSAETVSAGRGGRTARESFRPAHTPRRGAWWWVAALRSRKGVQSSEKRPHASRSVSVPAGALPRSVGQHSARGGRVGMIAGLLGELRLVMGMHRVVKSLVALLVVVFIGLVALLDYEVLLLIRHQSNIEATMRAAFSKVDEVLLSAREQMTRMAAMEHGLQDVRSRVSGVTDRYAALQENQQSLLTRFDTLVTRVELAFSNAERRRDDYAELLRAYQDSQQALVELRGEHDAVVEAVRRLDVATGAATPLSTSRLRETRRAADAPASLLPRDVVSVSRETSSSVNQ